MSKEKQIDYKEYARQMRVYAARDSAGNVICSAKLWEELARTIEMLAEYYEQSEVIANNATTTGEWISVEDRLPDKKGMYLVYTNEGFVKLSFYAPYYGRVNFENWKTTHWMPLPEPPKGGE